MKAGVLRRQQLESMNYYNEEFMDEYNLEPEHYKTLSYVAVVIIDNTHAPNVSDYIDHTQAPKVS